MLSKENVKRILDTMEEADYRRCPEITICTCFPSKMTPEEQNRACRKCWEETLDDGRS